MVYWSDIMQVVDILHPKRANVSKAELEQKLAERFHCKKECCVVYGLKTKFGGGRSTGFALVYDNEDYRKKFDSIPRLRKVTIKCYMRIARREAKEGSYQKAEKGSENQEEESQRKGKSKANSSGWT